MNKQELTGYPSIDKPWMKYYSQKAVRTSLPEGSIYDYLYSCNENYLERIALSYYGKKITFSSLFSNIVDAAKAFASIGVHKGDIVTICSVTTPETVYAFYALNYLGAISNMVDPRTSEDGIKNYINEVHSDVVICIDVALPKLEQILQGCSVEKVLIVSPADSFPQPLKFVYKTLKPVKITRNSRYITWKDFLWKANTVPVKAKVASNDCCVIVHTGGTTGISKGVMLSNGNLNAVAVQSVLTGIDMQREHNWMDIMPPFIAYGVGMGLHLPLTIGMETILIPSFDPHKFDELILKHKPIHMVGVPSYWGTIINSKKLQNKDLSYIIAPTVGGDAMDTTLEVQSNEFLRAHNCRSVIVKGYGMTEVSGGVAGTVDANNPIGSVGIPFVKSVISIFDPDTGAELSYGEYGEICIAGPNLMLGYYDNESATKEVMRRHEDGMLWMHSGDIGYMTEDGNLFVVDRIKRMIIRYDGFKVFPSQIEKAICAVPGVLQCSVVGRKDDAHRQGKQPVAYVVTGNKDDLDAVRTEIISKCAIDLPEYMQPADVFFIDELPLTPIGKVDYRALEQMPLQDHK